MSKLITINGYSIKLSKKEVANKLEMLFTTCTTINMDNLDKNISLVLGGIEDYCDCLLVKKAFNVKYAISNGEYFFKCITLKSSATLTDCVNELMLICDMLIKYGKVEYANKLLPNYRPDWFTKGQEVENTKTAEPAETTEPIQELSQDQSKYFYKKVELVKRATGYNGIITNNNINDSDRIAKYDRENKIITISNKLISDCFLKTSDEYGDDFLIDIICYEIASTKYVRNNVYRTKLNKELYNKVKELESTQSDTGNAEPVDYTKMSDNDLHDVVLSQLDYINRDLMETCVYNDLNGNGKYVRVGVNEFMDVTPALTEFNSRFGITEIFCMIYRHYESRKTHVEYDSFDDTMYIVEVIPYDDDGNIIEYGYYVGDYYVRYQGITENIEIVEVEENETENTNETKNEKEVKKSMEKSNRNFKVNGVIYSVVNNPNYDKNCSYEPSCQKYYAMKLLSTDGITKSWVKTGIYGNTIDTVKEKITEWEDFNQYVENYDNTKTAEVTNKINVEPAEPDTPVKDTNNLSLSDTAKTHIRNAYNWVIGELINGLCDNKPVSNEYKECFNMLHGGEKLVNHIYNECMENGFDVGWCGLGQAPAEIKKYDSWLIKNHIRNMLVLDGVFSLPADNNTIENEILNIPAKKMNSIIDLIEQCNSTMEKTMLLDYVSFETGISYDAIKQIYDDYIKETFLDDDTTFDSVIDEIYNTAFSDDIIPF